MLGDFEDQQVPMVLAVKRIQDLGQLAFELDVDDGAKYLGNLAFLLCHGVVSF